MAFSFLVCLELPTRSGGETGQAWAGPKVDPEQLESMPEKTFLESASGRSLRPIYMDQLRGEGRLARQRRECT